MEVASRSIYSGLPLSEQREVFTKEVTKAFNALRERDMDPNEACALALKVAAGVAELPPTPEELARRLHSEAGAPLGQLCSHVTRFFASSHCLQAAFWPKQKTSPACPLDFAAIASLYDTVLGCGSAATPSGREGPCPTPPPGGPPSRSASLSSTGGPGGPSGPSPSPSPRASAASLSPALSPSRTSFRSGPGGTGAGPGPGPGSAGLAVHSSALGAALSAGVEGLLLALGQLPHTVNPGLARQLGVLLANPLLDKSEHHDLLGSLVGFIGGLSAPQRAALGELLATYPGAEMRRLVFRLHGFISSTLFRMQAITRSVEDATRLLALLHGANEEAGRRAAAAAEAADGAAGGGPGSALLRSLMAPGAALGTPSADAGSAGAGAGAGAEAGPGSVECGEGGAAGAGAAAVGGGPAGYRPLEPSAFYNDAVNHEDFNLKEDFRKWKHPHKYDFCFCKFPFMYDPAAKARILQMENQMSQVNELHSALFRGLFGGGGGALTGPMPDLCPFLVLRVRRGPYLVQDTLIQIHRAKETDSLKKPLKVKFIGEEGVDEGGVAKEFFQLLVRQLFNPDYGMFTADPASHLHWFRPSRLELDLEFELVGILIGLAIYNSHILEFQFPSVLYKKLMGATVPTAAAGSPTATSAPATPSAAAAANTGGAGASIGTGGAASPAGPAAAAALGLDGSRSPGARGGAGEVGFGRPRICTPEAGGPGERSGARGEGREPGPGRDGAAEGVPPAAAGGGAGGTLGLADLRELAPEVASSLAQLLTMEPGLVEGLGLVFQVDVEMGFGEVESVDLMPGGGDTPVTAANRRLYVDLYVRHLLEDSISLQFGPFRRGFLRLCAGSALAWFSPSELELLVCGSRALRLAELEGATQYDDGYTRDSEPVRWFWEVVHSLPAASQKRLLFFVTGSDRVPIKGLAHLNPPFVISRAGAHSDRLPSAHTCFNHLLLPHYNSKAMLKERLELALQNAEGFGLM
ncbi:hypothetical protein HYH03_012734 [Edaphochlamys debaryana]|uniref:HECT-type E3 ubiquitin transferase n=1 Tax=Edaphochlamys debaryana TaxID=47281 RepID=A0A835XXL8_9CHLO|nr:hypothetical protein HYH03_012734 [Edaphochlamys debaryana]|eukprot:KAG2488735.1 hypothetical protein HYH03_012734 [Edaphochlamys debaryana]